MAENDSGNKSKDDDKKEGGAPPPESGSKISNTEWGIVIGALFLIDAVEIGIDFLFGIGLFTNPFIDILVGMAWPTYLHLRGVNIKSAKMAASFILSFIFQVVPAIDGIWGIEGLYVFFAVKAERLVKRAAEVAAAAAAVAAAPETGGASLAAEGAIEGGLAAGEAGGAAAEAATGAAEGGEAAAGAESGSAEGGETDEAGEGDTESDEENTEEKQGDEEGGESEGEKNKDKKKKKPEERQGGRNSLFGGGKRGGGSNPLDLRNRYRSPEEIAEDNRLQRHSDLIGGNLLSVVDREGTENKENEERSHSE